MSAPSTFYSSKSPPANISTVPPSALGPQLPPHSAPPQGDRAGARARAGDRPETPAAAISHPPSGSPVCARLGAGCARASWLCCKGVCNGVPGTAMELYRNASIGSALQDALDELIEVGRWCDSRCDSIAGPVRSLPPRLSGPSRLSRRKYVAHMSSLAVTTSAASRLDFVQTVVASGPILPSFHPSILPSFIVAHTSPFGCPPGHHPCHPCPPATRPPSIHVLRCGVPARSRSRSRRRWRRRSTCSTTVRCTR